MTEPYGPLDYDAEPRIHWSSLSPFFALNPRLRDVRIHFTEHYTPFELSDVMLIAQACPHLTTIHYTLQVWHTQLLSDLFDPRGFYRSSLIPETDELMEQAIRASYEDSGKITEVALNLDVFRGLQRRPALTAVE